jgi:transposase
LRQIAELDKARNAVITKETAANDAEVMIRQLMQLRAIGPELATLLVWEAYVRPFRNGKALGSYAGLTGTPFCSGGLNREQGISKDGNRRLRTGMVELAWLWLRWQPDSELSRWYRKRTHQAGARMRKVAIVALARKLLVVLWRYCREGLIPEGAAFKPSAPPVRSIAA